MANLYHKKILGIMDNHPNHQYMVSSLVKINPNIYWVPYIALFGVTKLIDIVFKKSYFILT